MDQKPYRPGTQSIKRVPTSTATQNRQVVSPQSSPQPIIRQKWLSKKLIISIVGIALVLIGAWAAYTYLGIGNPVHVNEYQAVYTADGKAYFGKLRNVNGTYLQLDDVYYFELGQTPQSSTSSAQSPPPKLVRLGQEIQKPHNTMFIKSSQVVWWENIQNDGKVTQAIEADKTQHP
jgi:hypothetical protein